MSPSNPNSTHNFGVLCFVIAATCILILSQQSVEASKGSKKDFSRRSIVFDIKTPKVFYCPQEKPSDHNKLIVKAKPLDKLCEFDGKAKPKGSPTDCYNDVDETEYACEEKNRFLLRLDPLTDASQTVTTTLAPDNLEDLDVVVSKSFGKKQIYPPKSKKL